MSLLIAPLLHAVQQLRLGCVHDCPVGLEGSGIFLPARPQTSMARAGAAVGCTSELCGYVVSCFILLRFCFFLLRCRAEKANAKEKQRREEAWKTAAMAWREKNRPPDDGGCQHGCLRHRWCLWGVLPGR